MSPTDKARIDDQALWSLVDRGGAALDEHIARHPVDRERVAALRATLGVVGELAGTASQPVPARIASYRVEREIGRGGCGVVYEAWQENPPRRVALKLLRELDAGDPTLRVRFEREAHALGRLAHPRIAAIYEAGRTAAGLPFIAMELIHGPSMVEFARARQLGVRGRVELVRDVCDAVQHAHRHGVIHRDLKPSNVLVDAERGVVVVDFGLARLRDAASGVTEAGSMLGTLQYMSPEQARGEHELVDERSDVYALGALLHELVVGSPPHDLRGLSPSEAARVVAQARPVLARGAVSGLDRDLETIVLHALERDREQRYQSVEMLAADLAAWLANRPILARRPSIAHRLRKLAARNKLVAALTLALLVFCCLGGYTVAFQPRLLGVSGDWYAEVSPFDRLRWDGRTPIVEVDGRWYELVAIEGLHVEHVLGFCVQEAGEWWRKRFSEDLLQVLNLMGKWPLRRMDLRLRDLETGEVLERSVSFDRNRRQALMRDRNAWPLDFERDGKLELDGRLWQLVAIDDLRVEELALQSRGNVDSFDLYCDYAGRSPGDYLRLELRDPETENSVFRDVPRARPARPPAITK